MIITPSRNPPATSTNIISILILVLTKSLRIIIAWMRSQLYLVNSFLTTRLEKHSNYSINEINRKLTILNEVTFHLDTLAVLLISSVDLKIIILY